MSDDPVYKFDPMAVEFMDQMYPGWSEHAQAIVALCDQRIKTWVYPKCVPAYQHVLICEELYCALLNPTPNKPPLGKES